MKRLVLTLTVMAAASGAFAQERPSGRPDDTTAVTRTAGTTGQQPPTAAQEGFLPVDELQKKEELPAAPLVMSAYAVAWLAIFVYIWSIWQRLGKVEREIADLGRRVSAGVRG
jgi:CcmD family protein